ncbi:MAG: 4-hydroxythreonine-4-phosphate dehydrogenase PdxA [Candidatus Omnitrophica bacterium]|jgi:4-hydroxythreonine-4-phosphate dehydrogenase|nr:4-hydroxythreonine-4-phosphate dehydrogenase PdxA [Candidatus Omnitrophota bacterium]MDD5691023.1 4-hydroxythreonine-4-phosphate dehydrogenase PdxA [Candidatus Omnitrophota bacterium]
MNSRSNPILKSSTIRIGLTIGDPAGIGPAIALKALELLKGKVNFTVIGDSFVLSEAAKTLCIKPVFSNLIDLHNVKKDGFVFGRVNSLNGKASLEYLDKAAELLKNRQLDCLVTCPISKEAINLAGSKFPGHTEYLADKFNCKGLTMVLINSKFRFSLVTRHIPLKDVCRQITRNSLENNILNTVKGLKCLFLIRKPRIVVCGVNPHASDNGIIGTEELRIIKPAIAALRKKCREAVITGPLSADVAISESAKGNFDCVIVLYHDQALIPLKLTDFDSGINLTFGLPFVRTSPLHGTAFDLATKPTLANPNSLIAAVKLAITCTLNLKKA